MNPSRSRSAIFVGVLVAFLATFGVLAALPSIPTSYATIVSCTTTVSSENVGNNAIQTAINSAAAGSTICIGSGTFPEQLTITQPITLVGVGAGSTIIQPTTVSTTAADPDTSTPEAPIILAQGTTGVTIENLTVDGSAASSTFNSCATDFIGILFLGASGAITDSTVTNMYPSAVDYGCQIGQGIFVQTPSLGSSVVTISGNAVTNYDKNGITCNDAGTECTISGNTISPLPAAEPYIASNGVQVAYGATGSVTGNTISGNECLLVGPNALSGCGPNLYYQAQGTGILVYEAGSSGVTISGNTLSSNDIGIGLYSDTSGLISPVSNNIQSAREYGVVVYDESETISGNTISNVPVGIGVDSDTSGLTATVTYSDSSDSFSGVQNACQPYMQNGGIAVCNTGPTSGVPEFGAPVAAVAATSLLGLLLVRKYGLKIPVARAPV